VKKYDIFLFDADNTLYDFDRASAHALEILLTKYGYGYSSNLPATFINLTADLWKALEKGEISGEDLQTERFKRLFELLGATHDPTKFNDEYIYEMGSSSFLIDGALEICQQITQNGKHLYIVTNGFLATGKARAAFSAIEKYKSGTFASEEVGYNKPAKAFFDHVLANIPKGEVLIVGDSLSADIAGGNAAGIDTCWFNPKGLTNKTGIIPTYEISNLTELQKFI